MQQITRLFTILALIAGALAFSLGFWYEHIYWLSAFLLAIGVVVAVIPEGLVPTLTLTLAIAVQRLASRGVLVKNLSMVETLGTTSVICTDKSGTLTQNQMTVREVWAGNRRYSISGAGYEPKGSFSPAFDFPGAREDLRTLLHAAVLCNNSRLLPPAPERPRWSYLGDQTEAALRVLALKGKIDEEEIQAEFPAHPRTAVRRPAEAHEHDPSPCRTTGKSSLSKALRGKYCSFAPSVRIRGENIPLDPGCGRKFSPPTTSTPAKRCGCWRWPAARFRRGPAQLRITRWNRWNGN